MVRRRNRDFAKPALALAGAGVIAGAATGGALARRRRRARRTPAVDAKVVVRRLLEERWRGDVDAIEELVAEDYVGHDSGEPEPILGPAGVRANAERFAGAFPGGAITVEAQLVDGDTIVSRWTRRGRHTGALAGIAPTGKEVTVSGMTVSRIERGRVVEEWTSWDRLGLLVQLGAVAEPAHA